VDTLHLAVYAHVEETKVHALLELLRVSRERGDKDPVFFRAGDLSFEVTWTRPPYAVALSSPAAHIRFMRSRRAQAPQIYLEIRSALLWRDGLVAAAEQLLVLIRSWETPRPAPTRVEVSRIDLASDFQGLSFDGSELPAGRWVCRATSRAQYSRADRADPKRMKARAAEQRKDMEGDRDAATYVHGRTHTGGAFGTGSIRVRYYRKDIELAKSGKAWMKALWTAGGWDGAAPIWRVEAQFLGPALASMIAHAGKATSQRRGETWPADAVTYGKAWRSVLRHLDAIWRYTMGEPGGGQGWLTLRDTGVNVQPTRWPVSAQWHAVQAVTWADVAEVHGAEAVGVARVLSRPTAAHLDVAELMEKGRGPEWAPVGQVSLPLIHGELSPELAARAVSGPDALVEWGPGPRTTIHAFMLKRTGEACSPPMDFDAMAAETRVKVLEDQLLGTAQALAAARELLHRQAGEPEEQIAAVAARLHELGRKDVKTWRTRVRAARAKGCLKGAIAYRLEVVRASGVNRTRPDDEEGEE
jgi:hypothetical protein